jgi:hypothetical protein
MKRPHVLRYTAFSTGKGRKAGFVVRAAADLACNGVWTSFEITGSVGRKGAIEISPVRER